MTQKMTQNAGLRMQDSDCMIQKAWFRRQDSVDINNGRGSNLDGGLTVEGMQGLPGSSDFQLFMDFYLYTK